MLLLFRMSEGMSHAVAEAVAVAVAGVEEMLLAARNSPHCFDGPANSFKGQISGDTDHPGEGTRCFLGERGERGGPPGRDPARRAACRLSSKSACGNGATAHEPANGPTDGQGGSCTELHHEGNCAGQTRVGRAPGALGQAWTARFPGRVMRPRPWRPGAELPSEHIAVERNCDRRSA